MDEQIENKRKATSIKVQISRITLSIPWIVGNIPNESILEVVDKKIVGISIRGLYHKVIDNVVQERPEGELGTNTEWVKLGAAIRVVNGEFSTSSIKKSAKVVQSASEPDTKKRDKGYDYSRQVDTVRDKSGKRKEPSENTDEITEPFSNRPSAEKKKKDTEEEEKKKEEGKKKDGTEEEGTTEEGNTEEEGTTEEGNTEEGGKNKDGVEEQLDKDANEKTLENVNGEYNQKINNKPYVEISIPPAGSGRPRNYVEEAVWQHVQDAKKREHNARLVGTVPPELQYETLTKMNEFLGEEARFDEPFFKQKKILEQIQLENAQQGEKEVDNRKHDPTQKLSMGVVNGVTPTHAETGNSTTAVAEHNVGVEYVKDLTSTIPGKVNDALIITEIDKNNSTKNQVDNAVLSQQYNHNTEVVEETINAAKGNTGGIDVEMEAILQSDTGEEEKTGEGGTENTGAETEPENMEEVDNDLPGHDIPGFNEFMRRLHSEGFVQSAEDPAERLKQLDAMRQVEKISDVDTASMLSDEQIKMIIDKDAIEKHRMAFSSQFKFGKNPFGTPVFVPDTARSHIHSLQQTVAANISNKEAYEIRKTIQPYWDEYKLVRLNKGAMEMSTMPTRIIKSDKSTLKVASKVRSDISQREESFGNFMFWVLHHKLKPGAASWRDFLFMSASLGYNDLTKAQINWLITGNPDGNLHNGVNFSNLKTDEGLDEEVYVSGRFNVTPMDEDSLEVQIRSNPEPQTLYPSRSMHPSANPTDNSIHPGGTTAMDRSNKRTIPGIPSYVMNIADPKYSMRGGEKVENVRQVRVRNEKWNPDQTAKEGEEGYEPKFIDVDVPDIAAGSKDIQKQAEEASADRLMNQLPLKLYPSIHPQACDRYLGVRNYKRLGVELSQYLKHYSQHPFKETDTQGMYLWNAYVMGLYGPILYSNVTDIQMQRIAPVFDPSTPASVADEYKELNELVKELKRYQEKSEDRADRISGARDKRPMEEAISNAFRDRDIDNMGTPDDEDDTQFPDTPFPSSDTGTGDDDAGTGDSGTGTDDAETTDTGSGGDNSTDNRGPGYAPFIPPPGPPRSFGADPHVQPSINGIKNIKSPLVGPLEIERGIVRTNSTRPSLYGSPSTSLHTAVSNQSLKRKALSTSGDETNKRARMFHAFQRR